VELACRFSAAERRADGVEKEDFGKRRHKGEVFLYSTLFLQLASDGTVALEERFRYLFLGPNEEISNCGDSGRRNW
jgi:hypothetical protein